MSDHFVNVLQFIDDKMSGDDEDGKYRALSQAERDLYDVNRFHFEVVLGGFGTFFTNSTGRTWRRTLAALERMGAAHSHDVLKRACALFPGGWPPADHGAFEDYADSDDFRAGLDTLPDLDDHDSWAAMERYCEKHFPAPPNGPAFPVKKPLDVREEVAAMTARLRSREAGSDGLYEFLADKGLDWSRAVVVTWFLDGCGGLYATLLDDKARLIDCELQFSEFGSKVGGPRGRVTRVEKWNARDLPPEYAAGVDPPGKWPRRDSRIIAGLELLAADARPPASISPGLLDDHDLQALADREGDSPQDG